MTGGTAEAKHSEQSPVRSAIPAALCGWGPVQAAAPAGARRRAWCGDDIARGSSPPKPSPGSARRGRAASGVGGPATACPLATRSIARGLCVSSQTLVRLAPSWPAYRHQPVCSVCTSASGMPCAAAAPGQPACGGRAPASRHAGQLCRSSALQSARPASQQNPIEEYCKLVVRQLFTLDRHTAVSRARSARVTQLTAKQEHVQGSTLTYSFQKRSSQRQPQGEPF